MFYKPKSVTSLVLTVTILIANSGRVLAQEAEPQLMQTPDGQIYIITTDKDGRSIAKALEPMGEGSTKIEQTQQDDSVTEPQTASKESASEPQVIPVAPVPAVVQQPGAVLPVSLPAATSYVLVPNPLNPSTYILQPANTSVPVQIVAPPAVIEADTKTASVKPEPETPDTTQTAKNIKAANDSPILGLSSKANKRPSLWENGGGGFSLRGSQININEESALREGIGTEAKAFGLGVEIYVPRSTVYFGFGLNTLRYEDEEPLSINVIDSRRGRVREISSSARAATYYGEIGQKFSFADDGHYLTLGLGYEEFIYSERYFSSCLNCPEQDIEMEAGAYGVIGFGSRLWKRPEGGGLYIELQHKRYESDESDFDGSNGAQFTWIF